MIILETELLFQERFFGEPPFHHGSQKHQRIRKGRQMVTPATSPGSLFSGRFILYIIYINIQVNSLLTVAGVISEHKFSSWSSERVSSTTRFQLEELLWHGLWSTEADWVKKFETTDCAEESFPAFGLKRLLVWDCDCREEIILT